MSRCEGFCVRGAQVWSNFFSCVPPGVYKRLNELDTSFCP